MRAASPTRTVHKSSEHYHPSALKLFDQILYSAKGKQIVVFLDYDGKQRKVADYYKKQERLLEGFNEMETMHETGFFPGGLTEDEMKQLAKNERMAVHVSNACNLKAKPISLSYWKETHPTSGMGIVVFASVMHGNLGLADFDKFRLANYCKG
ncbi:unnamed protein product [Trifolium pratense]|uniref:Uncharacterized protein n=1 Tax=Trifolium pratense TaxID=57577 RepID=A0ACB0KZL7_TRIPR|nr:unnamed protein product [Trifolium pratense]